MDPSDLVESEEDATTPINDITLQDVSIGPYKILEMDIWWNFKELKQALYVLETQCYHSDEDKIEYYHSIPNMEEYPVAYVSVLYQEQHGKSTSKSEYTASIS